MSNYKLGDRVVADGECEIVYISKHHKNDDPNQPEETNYYVKYDDGRLEIRTNASLSPLKRKEKLYLITDTWRKNKVVEVKTEEQMIETDMTGWCSRWGIKEVVVEV